MNQNPIDSGNPWRYPRIPNNQRKEGLSSLLFFPDTTKSIRYYPQLLPMEAKKEWFQASQVVPSSGNVSVAANVSARISNEKGKV